MWEVLRDFIAFVLYRRKLWMLPLLIVLFVFGSVIALAPGSPMSAFVYALF